MVIHVQFRPRLSYRTLTLFAGVCALVFHAAISVAGQDAASTKAKEEKIIPFMGMNIIPSERKILIPVKVNMCEGPVEYILVHDSGKTHESLFKTSIRGGDLNAALLLLLPKKKLSPEKALHSYKIDVKVMTQTKNGTPVKIAADSWVMNDVLAKPMKAGVWGYQGSRMEGNVYVANRDGSLIAIREDIYSVIGNPRPERIQDDIWRSKIPPPLKPEDPLRLELTISFTE